MSDINTMIGWMEARKGKVSYSMTNRTGPSSYDCSSSVFYALAAGGFTKFNYPGNTETLYGLVGKILKQIPRSEARRGDIFVSGVIGQSTGSGGHTGIFLDNNTIIHCTYSKGKANIAVTPAKNWMGDYSGLPVHCYRLIGTADVPQGDAKPQITQLSVDGQFGKATAIRVQEILGMAIRDGLISHQYKSKANMYLYSAQFDTSLVGSLMVKELQRRLKAKGYYTGAVDGLFGTGTIKAMQRAFGTTVDGIISPKSDMVKALQRALNANKLPF